MTGGQKEFSDSLGGKMMKIVVCDDSREDRGALRALLEAGGMILK